MTADDIRRLMRRDIDTATLRAAERNTRIGRRVVALLVQRRVLPDRVRADR